MKLNIIKALKLINDIENDNKEEHSSRINSSSENKKEKIENPIEIFNNLVIKYETPTPFFLDLVEISDLEKIFMIFQDAKKHKLSNIINIFIKIPLLYYSFFLRIIIFLFFK